MVSILTTSANTSPKCMPSRKNPFSSNLVVRLITSPFRFSFTLYTYLTPIGFFPWGISTSSHVLFFSIDSNFSFICHIQFGSLNASFVFTSLNSAMCVKKIRSPLSFTSLFENNSQSYNLTGMHLLIVDFLIFSSIWTSPAEVFGPQNTSW